MNKQILVTRSSMPPFDEYVEEIRPLWESHWLTNAGVEHEKFRSGLGEYLGVGENVELFVNGHLALECALKALELGADGRDEVITTSYTFASTTNAIVRCGLKPVFVDVKPDDLTIDPALVEAAITSRTCAILGVHVYGNLCDVDAIQRMASAHELKVVYDAAHAFGVRKGNAAAASFGDASMLSLHATKVFHSVEGGAVCFRDSAVRDRLRAWRNFGINPKTGEVECAGGNAKLDEFRAAMGVVNLRHVDDWIADRARAEARYRERLEGAQGVRLFEPTPEVSLNHIYMPVLFNPDKFGATRNDVLEALAAHGIRARRYFYPLTSDFPCYRGVFNPGDIPIAREASVRVLTLPLYEGLSNEDVDMICDVVLGCMR
ncbi:DegT/DnrJ/EryC1/StrS family aminotransferase [[Collinsella] massiliensis]|uniref:Aminotransferase n=1 Tax=[Collinsella] massiliensis TaxID=1232426 RepID=A0A1Y3XL55_9ACTN|nr:DegT/DnrJ/EryC1/StrS family aminotransferase [[Collinsella] massiliensis]OUN86244.1 aminotransferase [[Collinsella] massiliensis]